jgi:hypothetical protein
MPTTNTADSMSYSIFCIVPNLSKGHKSVAAEKPRRDDNQGEIRRIKTSLEVGTNGLNQLYLPVGGRTKILKPRNDTHKFYLRGTVFVKSKC